MNMKKISVLMAVCCMALACGKGEVAKDAITVIPYPNEVTLGEGVFSVKGVSVAVDEALGESAAAAVTAFAADLSAATGEESAMSDDMTAGGVVFGYDSEIPFEAYTLDITPEGVRVEASSFRGINYAIQTLKQMLPVEIFTGSKAPKADWTLPCAEISDSPRFAYRGLHLDEARHFFGIEQVKKYIDIMEVHKLNKFHWHLTDDQGWRIEIKKYPLLTAEGSIRKGTCIRKDFTSHDGVPYGEGMWYSQEQIKEIVAYAASKGIDVIPEIDLPGHMLAALSAYPELGCTGGPYEVWTRWGVSEDVLCAGNDKVYEFLKDVLSEVCELFPYEYVHIGGDECPKVRWEQCPKCQAKIKALGLEDKDGHMAEHFLQSHVMEEMEKFLASKGKRIIGWDEMLEGKVAPDATVMSWRGETGGLEAARKGHDAIMTPNTYCYIDYYQSTDIANEPFGIGGHLPVEKCYSYEPYVAGMTDEEKAHILGVQANLWTEYIADADHLEYMLLPRLAAISEVQWCTADRKDWNRFYDSADELCAMYDAMGYTYATHILQVVGEVTPDPENAQVKVELAAQGDAPIRYTLNGKNPGRFSKLYTEPLILDEDCVLKAAAVRKGIEPRYFERKYQFHKAVGADLSFSRAPHRRYCAGAPANLVDAIRGPQVFKRVEWTAWHGDPVDVTVDLKEVTSCSSVTLGFISDKPSYVFLPEHVSVAVSENGEDFVEVASKEHGVEKEDDPDILADFTYDFQQVQARFVKVTITPVKVLPEWHYAAGKRSYFFMDEIMVK